MKNKPCLLLLLAGAFASSHLQADPTIYSQPATDIAGGDYNAFQSDVTPNGGAIPTFDNFTLTSNSSVTAVQWIGSYVNLTTASANPASPDTTAFRVAFYADANGQPGSELSTATVALADCHPTLLGTTAFTNPSNDATFQVPIYTFSVTLPRAFTATAGQKYWVGIVSNCNADDPDWIWFSGTGGDGQCVQNFGGVLHRRRDRAFALQGTPATSPTLPSTFFAGEVALNNGVYYLSFPNSNYFGYYSFLSDPRYLYHFDLGYEYVFDAADGKDGVYLYDFASQTFFYTSPVFPFPYLYDFNLNTVLYYYPDPNNSGRYNTNGVRYFYRFDTGRVISK